MATRQADLPSRTQTVFWQTLTLRTNYAAKRAQLPAKMTR